MGDPSDVLSVSDVAPRVAAQEVTGFIDDAAVVASSLPELVTPESAVISATMEDRVHTITDVLARPVVVADFTWSDGNALGDVLKTLDFPQILFDKSANLVNKLNYFTYLRADVCVRIVVNANTFQAGKLLTYFTPFEPLVGNRKLAVNHFSAFSTYPHVINDASTGNVAELRIPYVAPYASYRLTDKIGNIGTLEMRVLNPLKTGDCNVTIYAWFTNISVDIPSGTELALTSTQAARRNIIRSTDFVAHVAGEEKGKSKVISSTLDKISTVASALVSVPVVGQVAAPVMWVTKFASTLAEYFGYSKSHNISTPCVMTNVPGYGFTNANGVDSSVVLATSHENSIEPRGDVFGSKVDDMDITAIVKHRALVDTFKLKTTDIQDTVLFTIPVTPGWCVKALGVYRPTPTAYVASMFQYWRGGLRYKIQAAKTAYHSGRVRISYIPAQVNPVTVDDYEQTYSWVLDLRNSSEIEFTIPYNNITEWALSRLVSETEAIPSIAIGSVVISVLNPLRAPSTVTQELDFNIWIAGDSDLQFAVPSFGNYVPSLPNLQAGLTSDATDFVAHVLGSQQDRGFNDMDDKPQLFSMKVPEKIDPCKNTIGEIVTNLRYLTRRFGYLAGFTANEDLQVEVPLNYFGQLYDPASTTDISEISLPPIDYISFLYRFYRGGLRFKFMKKTKGINGLTDYQEAVLMPGIESVTVPTQVPVSTTTTSLFDKFFKGANSFVHRAYCIMSPIMEVTTPFYSQTPIKPIVGIDSSQPTQLEPAALMYRSVSADTDNGVDILKASHDDFSFGWLIGAPFLREKVSNTLVVEVLSTSTLTEEGIEFRVSGVTLTRVLLPGVYEIESSLPANVDAKKNGTADVLPAPPLRLGVSSNPNTNSLVFGNPWPAELDVAGTLTNVKAVGNFTLTIKLN